jgi:hypothetical protein
LYFERYADAWVRFLLLLLGYMYGLA